LRDNTVGCHLRVDEPVEFLSHETEAFHQRRGFDDEGGGHDLHQHHEATRFRFQEKKKVHICVEAWHNEQYIKHSRGQLIADFLVFTERKKSLLDLCNHFRKVNYTPFLSPSNSSPRASLLDRITADQRSFDNTQSAISIVGLEFPLSFTQEAGAKTNDSYSITYLTRVSPE